MFEAVHARTGESYFIQDLDEGQVETLRAIGHNAELICPRSKEPLWVKAGELREWHFAHRLGSQCPCIRDPLKVKSARAQLGSWLYAKRRLPGKEGVQYDPARPVGGSLPDHTLLLWSDPKKGSVAFWVQLGPFKTDLLRKLRLAASQQGWNLVFVLLSEPSLQMDRTLKPSRLERSLLDMNNPPAPRRSLRPWETPPPRLLAGSLHYLDTEKKEITSLRQLERLASRPVLRCNILASPLASVRLCPPGDYSPTWDLLHETEIHRSGVLRDPPTPQSTASPAARPSS